MTVDSILNQIIRKTLFDSSLHLTKSRHADTSATSINKKPRPSLPIGFPDPPPLLPGLLSIGMDESTALQIDRIYTSKAADLRQKNQTAIDHLLGEIAQIPSPHISVKHQEEMIMRTVVSTYMRNLQTWVHEAKATCQDHLPRLQQSKVPTIDRSTGETKFNHAYVPLLEHFFDENPFPTHADKVFLAQKSGMTYRQIHIWFQNRRNRTKKEGKVLKKKPMSEGVTLPLDSLYRRMEKFIKPEEQRIDISPSNPSNLASHHEAQPVSVSFIRDVLYNPLESLAPPHAFPLPYPPSCSYDPFPSRNGTTNFGSPKWLRLPINTVARRSSLDIDALMDRFSRMNILDDSSSRLRGKDNSFAAVAAITVIPSSAPHPALIRGTFSHIAAVCGPLSFVPATASRRHVFDTPSPQSRPVTLIPIIETQTTQKTRRRKVAPLPRRVPHGNPIHRDATPAMSETSVASQSSPSRSSSFGSDSSSHTRLFSSSGSSSSSSSSVVTPSSSPSLSTQLASPSASSFSFSSNAVDLFGDALQGTPSPVEGLQLYFNPSALGNSLTQKSASFDFLFDAPPAANLVRTPS
nr:homeodomain [Rhizopogon roseolus]